MGGAIFGALGVLFAPQVCGCKPPTGAVGTFGVSPQISSALLGEDQKLKLPRFLEEEQDAEVTKDDLREKIAQLNNAIDEISNQLAVSETDGAVQTASRS